MQWLVKLIWNDNNLSHVPPGQGVESHPRRPDRRGSRGTKLARKYVTKFIYEQMEREFPRDDGNSTIVTPCGLLFQW